MSTKNLCTDLDYRLKAKQPVITELKPHKMVTVDIQGDPNQETARLMPPLYATAYAVRKIFKEKGMVFKVEKLRARWPHANIKQAKSTWRGVYALPVPFDVVTLPGIHHSKNPENIEIQLQVWEYQKVAMILHVGTYDTESESVELLQKYVQQNGFEIVPDSHEEIYLSDPNKTKPEQLKTIILYRLL